jgi:hypothetical protein
MKHHTVSSGSGTVGALVWITRGPLRPAAGSAPPVTSRYNTRKLAPVTDVIAAAAPQ